MKTIFILIMSLLSINLVGQESNLSKRISTGVKVGTALGVLGLENTSTASHSEVGLGYSIVVDFIEYRFTENLATNIGVGFTSRKYLQSVDNVSFIDITARASSKEYLLVQNVEVPLTIRYYLKKKETKNQCYLSVGSSLYYNLYHNSQQEILFSDGTIWEYHNQKDITRVTFSAIAGVGFEFASNYGFCYTLEPMLQVNSNSIDFYYGRDAKALISMGLLVGVKF